MKQQHSLMMKFAVLVAQESKAERLKVGAVLAKNGNILAYGYNGTPPGWDNSCEEKRYITPEEASKLDSTYKIFRTMDNLQYILSTKDNVIHAEMNILRKMANSHETIEGAILYITHAPCVHCSRHFLGIGVKELHYIYDYRSLGGVELFQGDNIHVYKVGDSRYENGEDLSYVI